MRITIREVKASYTADKREDARKDPWAHYVMRPLSFYVTYLLIRLGVVVPVRVVFVGMAIGLLGCVSFALGYLGYYWTMVLGAILININGLLDYVDGDMARTLNKVDEYGGRMDGLNYLLITGFLFISIGIGIHNMPWLFIGFMASFIRTLRFAITYQSQIASEEGKPNIVYRVGMATIGMREPLLLFCAIFGYLEIFLCFYAIVNIGEFFAVYWKVVKR